MSAPSASLHPKRSRALALACGSAACLLVLALLHRWRSLDYWNYSEGVYALISRLLLNGGDLYGDVVVAQPPVMFLAGAAMLAVNDSIEWLRLAVGTLQLVTAGLVALAVWRLTGLALAAAVAAPLALLTPWAVHEHGLLTPELVAAPLLVGGALLAARPRGAPAAAVALSLAVFVKAPFAAPALLVAIAAIERRRCLAWLAAATLVQLALWTALFGPSMWGDVVVAQQATGLRTVKQLAEYASQGLWNLLGLLVPAGAAVALLRDRALDRPLGRTCAALAAGLLLTLLTMVKNGTGVNVVVPVEAALVTLAVPGVAWALADGRSRALRAAIAAGLVLLVAQTASLFAEPRDPRPFVRPDVSSGFGAGLETSEVRDELARARRCEAGVAYSGLPYVAFVAGRRMPGGQPDGFLTAKSSKLTGVLAQIQADQPRCP